MIAVGQPLNRKLLGKQTFNDGFDAPGLGAHWKTQYWFGDQKAWTSRTEANAGGGDLTCYVDAGVGLSPFSVSRSILTITADHIANAPAAVQKFVGPLKYTSGIITTEGSFLQAYGYFEVLAKLPFGKGVWPAFWMTPKGWPPELDIFEVIGDSKTRAYQTSHWQGSAGAEQDSTGVAVADYTAWHTYGLLWTPSCIAWFIDGVCTKVSTQGVAAITAPMFMMINLGVGGNWPGDPDASVRFPISLQIEHVVAYALALGVP